MWWERFQGVGKTIERDFFCYKLPSTQNTFGRLKGKFRLRLKGAMDIDINVLLYQVIMACLVSHNYCEMKKETVP